MDPLAEDIIDLLRQPGRALTERELADMFRIERNRLAGVLDELRELGYRFSSDDKHCLSLVSVPDRMIDMEILAGLKTLKFGRKLHCYNSIGSTNERALQLADAGAPEGTVVVAEEQTKGRGRLGRDWKSAAGLGIWSSIILRPTVRPEEAIGLSLLAGLAVAETAERELGLNMQLKWPNDGLIDGKKNCQRNRIGSTMRSAARESMLLISPRTSHRRCARLPHHSPRLPGIR
jgi:BirA family biotin operon repressor/biotin-[acetyl-CoA-carboxylase] ligase